MSIYDELKPVAAELLKEFRQNSVKLVSIQTDNTVPDAPTVTETVRDVDATVRGVSFKYVKDGFVLATDLEVTVAIVDGLVVTLNDFIEVDGVRHKIVQDISVPAAGTRVVWKFIIRSGG